MGLTRYRKVVVDTAPCIYFLEGDPGDRRRALMEPLVRAGESGRTRLLVSTLTASELLTGPLRSGDRPGEAKVKVFVQGLCRAVPVDIEIAEVAARLRARHGLRTPDAIICATGLVEEADVVVGNDSLWKRVDEIRYVHLDDIA